MEAVKTFKCISGLYPPDDDKPAVYRAYKSRLHPGAIWIVRQGVKDTANHIYFGYPYDTKSQGFAGRWMIFPLVDQQESIALQGPWHSNADDLYEDVRIDVRDTHYVQFVAGLAWGPSINGCRVIEQIVYYEEPHYGYFDEYKRILFRLYNVYQVPIRYWHGGGGGSVSGTYCDRDYNRDLQARPPVDTKATQ